MSIDDFEFFIHSSSKIGENIAIRLKNYALAQSASAASQKLTTGMLISEEINDGKAEYKGIEFLNKEVDQFFEDAFALFPGGRDRWADKNER